MILNGLERDQQFGLSMEGCIRGLLLAALDHELATWFNDSGVFCILHFRIPG